MLKKSIALFDLDKTIYKEHSFFPVARYLVDQGTWAEIAGEVEKYKQGLLTYAGVVERIFDHLGAGLVGQEYEDVLETMVVGDSEHDIGMLERVRHPICFQPSEKLLVEAKKRNWMVVDETTAERTILDLLQSLGYGES